MSKRYSVTGTDTKVEKIIASCVLLQAVKAAGYRTASYKPIALGNEKAPKNLRNGDALTLQRNSSLQLDCVTVNPYTFVEPTPPHIISAQEDRPIKASIMSAGLHVLGQQADWMLVEGIGGWFTSFPDTFTFVDWVAQEQLPVMLVVGVKPGYISRAILIAQAILHVRLTLAGQVANNVTPLGRRHAEYMTTLIRMIPAPLLDKIPWLTENPENATTGGYINPALM